MISIVSLRVHDVKTTRVSILTASLTVGITLALVVRIGPCSALVARSAKGLKPALSSTRTHWRNGEQLELVFTLLNYSKRTVCIDGRMSWPGNVYVHVRLPDGKVLLANRLLAKMQVLTAENTIRLRPNCLYGRRLSIDPRTDREMAEPLRHLRPGKYSFWVVFYGHGLPSANCDPVSLRSNEVTVLVR